MDFNWKDIKSMVGKYAPLLATVIGGPKAFAAQALIGKALGVDSTPQAVGKALSDPYSDNHAKILKLEQENERELAKLALESERVELEDRDKARQANEESDMPAIIVMALTFMAGAYGYSLMFFDISEQNRALVTVFATQLMTLWGGAVAYWVGTSKKKMKEVKSPEK
ncbi:hypothetical protein [Alteromonas sp. BMJM2]|uniref:hypothetical protein n=1 Tax=Alteromonas sp. BMJM2 TaxID=2954241 RepID=UPI0022B5E1A4|nr:hypothetical protein [Alteromonas sp. BMJM2]